MEANWTHRTPEEVAELTKLLDELGVLDVACPVCGTGSWDVSHDALVLLNPEPRGLEVIPISCKRCGFTRPHSTRHLKSPFPEGDDAPG